MNSLLNGKVVCLLQRLVESPLQKVVVHEIGVLRQVGVHFLSQNGQSKRSEWILAVECVFPPG